MIAREERSRPPKGNQRTKRMRKGKRKVERKIEKKSKTKLEGNSKKMRNKGRAPLHDIKLERDNNS